MVRMPYPFSRLGILGRESQEPVRPVDVEAYLGVGNSPSLREEGGVAGAPIGDHCVGPRSRVFHITLPGGGVRKHSGRAL